MTGKRAFIDDHAAFLAEWTRETEREAGQKLDELDARLRRQLEQSDQALLRRIENEVVGKVRTVEESIRKRLADAQKLEREGREAQESARTVVADAQRRLAESTRINVTGNLGPAALAQPLAALLRGNLSRVMRVRDQPPSDAWYVVAGLAFATGEGSGVRLQRPLSPADADTYANQVGAVVLGIADDGDDCLGVVHNCSLYSTVSRAREVAEKPKLFVKSWVMPASRVEATDYCRDSWAAAAAQGTKPTDWLWKTKGFSLVPGKDRMWVLDMSQGVDVASWTDRCEEAFKQLQAAGVEVTRGERRRGVDDKEAHGKGFYLAKEVAAETPGVSTVSTPPAEESSTKRDGAKVQQATTPEARPAPPAKARRAPSASLTAKPRRKV